jgi:DNA-binding PadR family transcriptional regulator
MMARGFSYEMLQALVRAGLASTQRDVINGGKERVAYLRITGAGRTAIVE